MHKPVLLIIEAKDILEAQKIAETKLQEHVTSRFSMIDYFGFVQLENNDNYSYTKNPSEAIGLVKNWLRLINTFINAENSIFERTINDFIENALTDSTERSLELECNFGVGELRNYQINGSSYVMSVSKDEVIPITSLDEIERDCLESYIVFVDIHF